MICSGLWRTSETEKKLLKVMEQSPELIVFDTETTGLSPNKERVIQVSAIKYKILSNRLEKIDTLDKFINPEFHVKPRITQLTGITNEMLETAESEKNVFSNYVLPFFGLNPCVAAYNSNFDVNFFKAMYERNGMIFEPSYELDVLKMAKDLVPKVETPNYKLETMARLYGVDDGITFHNSLDDTTVTAKLMQVFYLEYLDNLKKRDQLKADKKLDATIISMKYYKTSYGMQRIYINTNLGSFFYDIRNKRWGVKNKENPYSVEEINMEKLRKDAFSIANVSCEEEFARFRT